MIKKKLKKAPSRKLQAWQWDWDNVGCIWFSFNDFPNLKLCQIITGPSANGNKGQSAGTCATLTMKGNMKEILFEDLKRATGSSTAIWAATRWWLASSRNHRAKAGAWRAPSWLMWRAQKWACLMRSDRSTRTRSQQSKEMESGTGWTRRGWTRWTCSRTPCWLIYD